MMYLQGAFGLMGICLIAWALSENRKKVSLKIPLIGIALQLVTALILLKFPLVQGAFVALNDAVLALQAATQAGTSLVFGFLGGADLPFEEPYPGAAWIFAFRGLPLILVMSALSALLFYWKILPRIIQAFSWILQKSMGVSGAVGVSAAANIFVGMVEAPLFVRPYLSKLSRSELFMVMTCGLASVAGTVMVIYAAILGHLIDNVLGHILTASLISAPAAIMISWIMVPQDADHATDADITNPLMGQTHMEVIVDATTLAIQLILSIVALLIVMVALVHLVNLAIGWPFEGWSVQKIFGYLLAPLAWLMGVPSDESLAVGQLLGTRLFLTEFVAYLEMAQTELSDRSHLILLYGLCGFASLPSLGIMIGGLGAMVPERRAEIIELGIKSVIAATLATAMTGGVIGLLS